MVSYNLDFFDIVDSYCIIDHYQLYAIIRNFAIFHYWGNILFSLNFNIFIDIITNINQITWYFWGGVGFDQKQGCQFHLTGLPVPFNRVARSIKQCCQIQITGFSHIKIVSSN